MPRSFYERPTLEVARDLIGAHLHRRLPTGEVLVGQIVEAEGYLGASDPAAHTHRGVTKRNQVMFGPAGHAYVYFIYGMYWNMNVVTRPQGTGEGVLIRAITPIQGEATMRELRRGAKALADGPGKLCQAFSITGDDYGTDVTVDDGNATLFITQALLDRSAHIQTTPRIGIDYASNKHEPWRFIDKGFVKK